MKLLFYFLLFLPYLLFSQVSAKKNQTKKFDSIFYDVAVNVSSANPMKAMHIADSLHVYSINDKQKIKTIMLMADILEKQEKRGEAILKALEALEVSKKDEDYVWQSRIYGFLSTQYRIIGFIDKGKSFLKKGVEASTHFTNKQQILKYKAMSNHEMAEYAFEEKDYYKVIEYIELAKLSYKKEENPEFRNFVTANAEEMLGRSYMLLGENEVALSHFLTADLLINKSGSGNSLFAGLIYQGLGESFLRNKKTDSAEIYLKKALLISDKGYHNDLKEKIYKSVYEFYKQINKVDSFMLYSEKYNAILDENRIQKKLMINKAYNALQNQPNKRWVGNYVYIIVVAVCFAIVVFYFYRNRIGLLFKDINKRQVMHKDKSVDCVLSKKTEDELLEKLKLFESSNKFLDKNISLPTVIGQLNTNTKYFRQILKKYKETDFNNYINELRIQYILDMLNTDKKYLNYKISVLAEECGFSSHSKFSASFKSITGICPSDYINNLKNKPAT
ncbi:helix-turn-helix domain-containing protein [Winogradskyella undariae]|uniref:helix-turn-helix domain-containing protein n=1 Tax=Winogradskyella undariae TaxID=1285465 RepID=UPI0015CDB792|nr:helix-turn-helix domain-containing protein [Winogradskyella undariae]